LFGEHLAVILTGAVAATFFWASFEKFLKPRAIASALENHVKVNNPRRFLFALANGELAVGFLLLISDIVDNTALAMILVLPGLTLSLGFVLVLVRSYVRGVRSGCGCFGQTDKHLGPSTILRSVLFMMAFLLIVSLRLSLSVNEPIYSRAAFVLFGISFVGAIVLTRAFLLRKYTDRVVVKGYGLRGDGTVNTG
jgi:hypothetical protein